MAGVKAIDPAVADPIVLSSRLVVELYPTKNITHHIRHVAQPRKRAVPVTDVWKRVKGLGEGTYGKVYMEKCVDGPRLQELQAVKRIRKRPNVDWEGELRTIALFSAEMFRNSFVESTGWYETSSHVYVVMELVEHGDLQKHLRGPLPEQEGQTIIFQILQGLSFLHQQGFAHRDLKPKARA
jgi:calcium/calmodulin-dependent protein kinase I